MLIRGSCHCSNIAFALDWQPDPAEIPVRACDCTFCTRHAALWTSKPDGSLRIAIADRGLLSSYAFGTRTAEFHVCARCGAVPLVTSRIDGALYAVVNVNTFRDVQPSLLRRAPVSFDGESGDARLARRRRNWIGDVAYVDAVP
jgi:hypothetical protein